MSPKKTFYKPDGAIRRSQILTSGGPGAVVDLVDYAVIIKGLDRWRYADDDDGFVQEPRLESQALKLLRGAGNWKHNHVRLRLPPRCEDDGREAGPWRGIPARVFPRWYQCRSCRSLFQPQRDDNTRKHTCHAGGTAAENAVPIRFVGGCSHGHLQDLNWRFFVHHGQHEEGVDKPFYCAIDHEQGKVQSESGETYSSDLALITTGSSGDLSDLVVLCRRCGRTRSLQDLRQPHALGNCLGWRPWLENNDPSCDEQLRLLIRTGSNVWFPQRLSVLSIPESSSALRKCVSKHWGTLKKVESSRELVMLMDLVEALATDLADYPRDEVLDAIRLKRAGADTQLAPIREAEWLEFMSAEYGYKHDLPPRGATWFARRAELELPDFVDRVVMVHALREVRAMVGFTRIEGVSIGAEGDLELEGQRTAPLSENADWVPTVELQGEGVFLALSEEAVRAWEALDAVRAREQQFREGLTRENEARSQQTSTPFTGARLLMLHSLAHMLISQISLECGYSASAIRERIYCYRDPEDPTKSRAGILLYTGTPGSEGTLGGLVEVGADIVRHLRQAVQRNLICSNDPVCAQHTPNGPEDGRRREGAACHGCLLIAEPSCERMNRDLDRALVVPTLESADAAFLKGWG